MCDGGVCIGRPLADDRDGLIEHGLLSSDDESDSSCAIAASMDPGVQDSDSGIAGQATDCASGR